VVGRGYCRQGVDMLLPGHFVEFDGAGKEVRQKNSGASRPRPGPNHGPRMTWPSSWERAQLHLASDVPLSVFFR